MFQTTEAFALHNFQKVVSNTKGRYKILWVKK